MNMLTVLCPLIDIATDCGTSALHAAINGVGLKLGDNTDAYQANWLGDD